MTLVIESKAYIVPDRSRYAAILPPNQFTPERVEDVTGILNGHREYILAGMREAAPPREKALVGQIYDGDADRVSGLSSQHGRLYGDGLELLKRGGNPLHRVGDFGSGLGRHWAVVETNLQPKSVICVDNNPTICGGLGRVLEVLAKEKRIPRGYQAVLGNENTNLDGKLDAVVHVIGPQYVDALDWLMAHSNVAYLGEVMHSRTKVPEEICTNPTQVKEGTVIPIISNSSSETNTGFGWRVESEPIVLKDGQAVYNASFVVDGRMYEAGSKHAFITSPDDAYHAQINIFPTQNGLYAQSWRIQIVGEEDEYLIKAVAGLNAAISDGFERISDTTRILLMPGRGAQRGWYSATRLTTEAGKFLSPKVGVGVANRYRSMLSELADRGGLRCVGEGRLFSRFDELMEYINNPRVVREAKMQRPVTIGVTMFKGERNFNQFLEGLKAA